MAFPGHIPDPSREPADDGPRLGSVGVRAAYREKNAEQLRHRIDLGVAIFAAVGIALVVQERAAFLARRAALAPVLAGQAVVCAAALALARWRRERERLPVV